MALTSHELKIIGCSFKVYNILGHGFLESVYKKLLLIELKIVKTLITTHEVQLVNYLVATNKAVGLLIKFEEHKVDIKRKYKNCKYVEK
ncbi:MAG: GxxExxY protein [Nitrospinota bacterium]|nr:GxxExxY protein [Nitrospinota bacterium]